MQNHRAVSALGNFEQALFECDFERQQVNQLIQHFTETLVIAANATGLGADVVE